MAATNNKLAYAASADLTITLASLATSSTLVAGREATSISNTTNLYFDAIIGGRVTTGTTPTAGYIEVWAVCRINGTPTWPDVFDGTDSAETVTSRDILAGHGRLLAAIPTDTTSDRAYYFSGISLRNAFGEMPPEWTVFVTHNTAVNLNATGGNHYVSYVGVYSTSGG